VSRQIIDVLGHSPEYYQMYLQAAALYKKPDLKHLSYLLITMEAYTGSKPSLLSLNCVLRACVNTKCESGPKLFNDVSVN
jgi:hypothetical protein